MNLYRCILFLNLASPFLEAITRSWCPDVLASSFTPQHDSALFFIMPNFLCLYVSLSCTNLLYLVDLPWITLWNMFYKCLMNWLHDNKSVDLVSINVKFCAASLTGMNEPADAAEVWRGWLAQRYLWDHQKQTAVKDN